MIAFVFPGQGSQHVGMGKELAENFAVCRDTLDEADDVLGELLSATCFTGPAERLLLTENTQPAILAVSVAVYRLLVSRGVTPAIVAGHSLGEYSAHVAAGTISFADALRTVRRRGQYMQESVPVGTGAMAAVLGIDADTVARACAETADGEVVSPANLNAPGQVVIAGSQDAVARAGVRAKELGARRVVPISVSAPFHCALMKPAERRLEPDLRALVVTDPVLPVVANVDGRPKQEAGAAIDALIRQVSAPVLWEAVVQELVSTGADLFVEVGPGTVLGGLIKKIDRSVSVVSVGDMRGLERLEEKLAETPDDGANQ
jgi:[acyl-carrier-protein] S-malonyltransferase